MSSLLAATASCVYSFELLMMGGETAWNMYRIESNKEIRICCVLLVYLKECKGNSFAYQWSRM